MALAPEVAGPSVLCLYLLQPRPLVAPLVAAVVCCLWWTGVVSPSMAQQSFSLSLVPGTSACICNFLWWSPPHL